MSLRPSELRVLIDLLPLMEARVAEAGALVREAGARMKHSVTVGPAWAHVYDLSFREHMALAAVTFDIDRELIAASKSELPISALRDLVLQVDEIELDTEGMTDEEMTRAAWGGLSLSLSMYNTMRCLMTFGRYINEMLAVAREKNDDKALLNAIRVDPTVVGSRTALVRLSRAVLERDSKFLGSVRKAMKGSLTKRQEANFQKMRLVVRVLADSGAGRLSDDELVKLFAEELHLYPEFSKSGDIVKNLRTFVDRYMKLSTTRN